MKMLRYLVRLDNNDGFSGSDAVTVLNKGRKLAENLGATIKVVRVSSAAIELDVFVPDDEVLQRLLRVLSSSIGKLESFRRTDVELPPASKNELIEHAKSLFNEQRFWECHEALEQIWRRESGQEREILQGIILTAAALVHYQRGRDQVSLSVFKRAYEKLRKYSGLYFGIDINYMKSSMKKMLDTGAIEVFKI